MADKELEELEEIADQNDIHTNRKDGRGAKLGHIAKINRSKTHRLKLLFRRAVRKKPITLP